MRETITLDASNMLSIVSCKPDPYTVGQPVAFIISYGELAKLVNECIIPIDFKYCVTHIDELKLICNPGITLERFRAFFRILEWALIRQIKDSVTMGLNPDNSALVVPSVEEGLLKNKDSISYCGSLASYIQNINARVSNSDRLNFLEYMYKFEYLPGLNLYSDQVTLGSYYHSIGYAQNKEILVARRN